MQGNPMLTLSHQNRHLLLFAADPTDPDLVFVRRDLDRNREAVAERHLAIHVFIGDGGDEDAAAARTRYRLDPGAFCMILVGKDGGEKRRDHQAVPVEEIFALVDSMPMRRREMGLEY